MFLTLILIYQKTENLKEALISSIEVNRSGEPYDYRRKSPEELLKEFKRLKRGKWTLYIGSAPGVGKTYRMLQEAHE